MKVWNVIEKVIDLDEPLGARVCVWCFPTEERAMQALERIYGDTLEVLGRDSILDIVGKENYGNNAKIELGYEGHGEIETVFSWRVSATTADEA